MYKVRDGKPVETRILTLGGTGLAREQSIHLPAREFSFADLKGDLDEIAALAGGADWQSGGPQWLAPNRAARISLASNGQAPLGVAGQLTRDVAHKFKFRQDVYLAELLLEPFLESVAKASAALRYEPLPRFPAVERDFSLILDDRVTFAAIEQTIRALAIPILRAIQPLDLFRDGQIPAGKHSLLLRVTFQSDAATLTEAQVADFSARIASALAEKLGASLRTS